MRFWTWAYRQRKNSSTAGLTLLEVLAVMVIIGILAALTAPGWLTFVSRQRANRAQDQVLQALRKTQADARRTRQDRTLTLVFDVNGLPAVDFDSPAAGDDPLTGVEPARLAEGDLEPGAISMRVVENGTPTDTGTYRIRFDPNGGLDVDEQAINLPLYITIASPANSDGTKRCIIVRTLLGATQEAKDADCEG